MYVLIHNKVVNLPCLHEVEIKMIFYDQKIVSAERVFQLYCLLGRVGT